MKLEQFITATRHQITSGSEYQWQCYGDHARWLDAGWTQDGDRWSAAAVFDSRTQQVYECQVADYRTNRAWQWRDPTVAPAHDAEAQERGVDAGVAWDAVPWLPVTNEQEMLHRISVTTDSRETLELELGEDEMLRICMQAHELDMTLNQYVEMVLRRYIEQHHPEVLDAPEAAMKPRKSRKSRKK